MQATIKDVAKRAGVSISTVSRVLNETSYVEPDKKEAVLEAVKFYGYRQNQFGRGLVKQKSEFVGLYMLSDIIEDSIYCMQLLRGIQTVLANSGYSSVLINESSFDSVEDIPKFYEYAVQKRIDGLILFSINENLYHNRYVQKLYSEGFPIGYIGPPQNKGDVYVYANFEFYSAQIVRRFYNEGHKKITLLMGDYFKPMHKQIMKNLENAVHGSEITIHYLKMSEYDVKNEKLVSLVKDEIYQKKVKAFGLFDRKIAYTVYGICQRLKLNVPEDVSMIGVEHHQLGDEVSYPLISYFYVPAMDMGKAAGELILDEIRNKKRGHREFEPQYIEMGTLC